MLKMSISGTNTSLQTFMLFTGMRFINDCMLQAMLHLIAHCFIADITDPLLSMLHCFTDCIVIEFRLELLRWPHSKMNFEVSYAIEIGSNCNFQDSQGSVAT